MEARLKDTGASRPAGWRQRALSNPTLQKERPSPKPLALARPSPRAPGIYDDDEADTSIQAIIMKTTVENSASVGCGNAANSKEEIEMSLETDDATTEKVHRRKNNRKRQPRKLQKITNDNHGRLRAVGLRGVEARETRDGNASGKGAGDGGDDEKVVVKRQKLSIVHHKGNRQKDLDRELRKGSGNEGAAGREYAEVNKEGNLKLEKEVSAAAASREEFDFNKDGNAGQGFGWASRIWGAVQRFTGRV